MEPNDLRIAQTGYVHFWFYNSENLKIAFLKDNIDLHDEIEKW